jgi:hypothetical protein
MDLLNRTLRLTAYTVDSTTRIRSILGHVFMKFDRFISSENNKDRTFSTAILSEYLTADLPTRVESLGELILTSYFNKDQNLLRIRIQEIHQLQIERMTSQKLVKGTYDSSMKRVAFDFIIDCLLLFVQRLFQWSNNQHKSSTFMDKHIIVQHTVNIIISCQSRISSRCSFIIDKQQCRQWIHRLSCSFSCFTRRKRDS